LDREPAVYSFELKGDSSGDYRVKREHAAVGAERFDVHDGKWTGPEGLAPQIDLQALALPAVGGDRRFARLFKALQSIAVYAIFPDVLRTPHRYDPQKPMNSHGSNWASVLKDQPRGTWEPELLAALKKLTGDVDGVKVDTAAGLLVVQFRHLSPERKPKWMDAAQESDGTLRVAGIVTALLQVPAVPILAIEEPELTVHPGAIRLIVDYIRQASQRSQVILTTHSPELLDMVEPEDVRVVERIVGEDGEASADVRPLAARQRQAVRDALLSLGDLARTEGLQSELPLAP
jgi:predicted ATPase